MRALYPGSFDPPHMGHLDVIRRASALCEELVVGVAVNPAKASWLPVEERCRLLRDACCEWPAVQVVSYAGATVAAARRLGVRVLVRGVRGPSDLVEELAMAAVHRQFGLETILLPAEAALAWISSRLVRELHAAGLPLTGLIPPSVAVALADGSGASPADALPGATGR